MKGPSDTTTKLIDKVEEQLGIRKPRTIATARLLTIGAVAFHRSNQMIKSKIQQYSTDTVRVSTGLTGGETIVSAGVHKLDASQRVRPWENSK